MIENPFVTTGLLLILGYWGGRLANMVSLPRISGYLLVGLLFSPSLFHVLSHVTVNGRLHFITDIALSIIAFNIGGSLDIRGLKGLGGQIGWITIFQAAGAMGVVFLVLFLLLGNLPGIPADIFSKGHMQLAVALVVGAISAATAPGAILAVISEAKAKGQFTNILLGVIALDDALTIVLFSIAGAISQAVTGVDFVVSKMIVVPIVEIGLSLVLGMVGGLFLSFTGRIIERKEANLMMVLGVLFALTGLSYVFHASTILSNMVAGFVVINHQPVQHNFFSVLDLLEDAVFGLFFTLAGAHMDLGILKSTGVLAVLLLVFRMVGKQAGVWIGAKVSKASDVVAKYLGLALFPQAGVTIGLVLLAQDLFPEDVAVVVVNGVIGSVILNEFIAPALLHFCLRRVGEANQQ